MGWKLKAFAVFAGLVLLSAGVWFLAAILFLYAASGPILRGLRRGRRNAAALSGAPSSFSSPQQQQVVVAQARPTLRFKGRLGHPLRLVLGLVFLGLSAVAFSQGGTYSPLVFGGVGAVLLLWGTPLVRVGGLAPLRPVEESILMKRSLDPIHWFAMAEVKLATRQVGKALGGIDETLIVTGGDSPSILVVLKATSSTLNGAQRSIVERMRELTRISAPLGAYILPLDSGEAVDTLGRLSVEPVELEAKGWPHPLSMTDYDVLSMDVKGGYVRSMGAYRTTAVATGDTKRGRKKQKIGLPPMRQSFSQPPLLWEAFQELGNKVQWPKPDAYTTFLASIFATTGEIIGERVNEAGSTGSPHEVLVQSLGTPAVQISRVQLRAIFAIYT